MTRIVCFGEVMLRLAAPDRERLLQSARLAATFGGAEANVAVSLARLGDASALVSTVPDNVLSSAALDQLRMNGVDLSGVRKTPGRLGLYFLTPGAVQTPSDVLYDRADSAFARAPASTYDWPTLLEGADWLHISGITPAVGANACEAALMAAQTAVDKGVKLSFDGNFRSKLWALWDGRPGEVWRKLMSLATIAFANELDIALALGETFDQPDLLIRRRFSARRAFDAFPRLTYIANTVREMDGVDGCTLTGLMYTRDGDAATGPHRLQNIVDRIGGGDAFAAGVLHGLIWAMTPQGAIEFGLAASVLKHAVPGDFNPSTAADVNALIASWRGSGGLDVRR